ncbi:DUF1365 domain-containing protein [Duganella qianjiadongensis]|uniref:DUF1365 family protein n=1 Tax=Duganella qianjiadongensis TaxID=2692176 RepID=A0ABW9VKB4_9BURK|nr:DUF1365 domain-containing protein [Duganella qianjiadongensis]MYM39777.1 DUF1365 family protein [Duganella qianjiadongensis]
MNHAAQLLQGQVMHARLRPTAHRFVYPVCYVRLNLDQLEQAGTRWFGIDRWRPLSVRTRDYGPRDGSSLALWMRQLLASHGVAADGAIWLQTFPRVFGYVFNPVSFWHCHDAQGQLRAVLAEVNSTFGETHRYLLTLGGADGRHHSVQASKHMHVSPFCAVEGHYRFRFRLAQPAHSTSIDYYDAQGLLLRTSVSGRPRPLDDRAVLAALLRFPLLGVGIVARIHWQALRLWLKRVPFFRQPQAPLHSTTVHQEITQ